MADEPKPGRPEPRLSEETIQSMKSQMIYGAGYGQPPKQHQFKKGQSGNPKGRPRKAPPDLTLSEQPMLNAVLNGAKKTVNMREGNKVTELAIPNALVEALFASALKGNARSLGMAIDLVRTTDTARMREINRRNELWENYQSKTRAAIAAAKEHGHPVPEFLPHPDDIVIDRDNGPRFLGPFDEDELKMTRETQSFCEVLIMQDELDQRSTVRLDGQPLKEPGAALLLATMLNNTLPPRLQLSSVDIIMKQMRVERMTKRELLKSLYHSWRTLGQERSTRLRLMRLQLREGNSHVQVGLLP